MTACFLTDRCPKCDKPANLKVVGWYPVIDKYGDGGTVYFAVQCPGCFSYAGGTLYYEPTGAVMSQTLSAYADKENNISKFFQGKEVEYIFDYHDKSSKKPLIVELLKSSNTRSETITLLRQIYKCLALECWDAVGILCRKIIDIETSTLWGEINPAVKCPDLFNRIKDLYPEKDVKHHVAHVIRLIGNDAVHNTVLMTRDDAHLILRFTESLLKKMPLHHGPS